MKEKVLGLLKWSEKYTQTDMNYLVFGSFWLTLGQGFNAITAILLAILFANILTPEQYGTYQFIISMAGVVAVFSLNGMRFAIIRGVAKVGNAAFRAGFFTFMKWSVVMATIGFAIAIYYFLNGNNQLAIAMFFVGAFSPFFRGFGLYQALLVGQKKHDVYSRIRILYTFTTALFLVAAIFLTTNPVIIAFVYLFAHTTVLGFIYLYVSKKYGKVERDYNKEKVDKHIASYGTQLSFLNMGNRLAAELDKVLMFHFLGPASLAVYALAYSPVKEIRAGGEIMRTLILPKLSTRSISDIKRTLLRKAFIFFLIMLPIVFTYYFVAPYLYATLFPKYLESIIYSQLLIFTLLFLPIIMFRQAFIAKKQTKSLYIIDTVLPIFKILLLIILLPLFGINGAIITIFVHLTVSLMLLLYLFGKMK